MLEASPRMFQVGLRSQLENAAPDTLLEKFDLLIPAVRAGHPQAFDVAGETVEMIRQAK